MKGIISRSNLYLKEFCKEIIECINIWRENGFKISRVKVKTWIFRLNIHQVPCWIKQMKWRSRHIATKIQNPKDRKKVLGYQWRKDNVFIMEKKIQLTDYTLVMLTSYNDRTIISKCWGKITLCLYTSSHWIVFKSGKRKSLLNKQ